MQLNAFIDLNKLYNFVLCRQNKNEPELLSKYADFQFQSKTFITAYRYLALCSTLQNIYFHFFQGSWAMMIRKVGKVISATCFNDIDLETYRNRHINISSPETGCLIKSNIQYFIKIYLYILIWDVKGFPLKKFLYTIF